MSFGPRIRQLRLDKRLSQPELSERVGIDGTYLSKIENGKVPPPAEGVIRKLAKCLGCDEEELLVLGNKLPTSYVEQIQKDPLVADFFRKAPELSRSQRIRIQRIIHETERG